MAKAIAGFFHTQADGERAQKALFDAGFTQDEVSYLAGDTRGHQTPKVGPALMNTGSESEAVSDAFVGGAVGLAAGVIAVALPGIGPLLAAGPLAGWIAGLTAGAVTGGAIGLLKDYGVSEEQAEFYAEGVRRGGSLVTVHGVDEDREKVARELLNTAGAIEVEELADERNRSEAQPRTFRAG